MGFMFQSCNVASETNRGNEGVPSKFCCFGRRPDHTDLPKGDGHIAGSPDGKQPGVRTTNRPDASCVISFSPLLPQPAKCESKPAERMAVPPYRCAPNNHNLLDRSKNHTNKPHELCMARVGTCCPVEKMNPIWTSVNLTIRRNKNFLATLPVVKNSCGHAKLARWARSLPTLADRFLQRWFED